MLFAQGRQPATAAEPCLTDAISIAQKQEAKFWELRAAMALAQGWTRLERRVEARELLAPVYGWFTEGFDTPDLKEAKALLEELAA
jgi:predicted ATPase